MATDLRMRLVLDLAGKAVAPLKRIGASSESLATKLRTARGELRQLQQQQAAISSFRALSNEFRASAGTAQALRTRLAELRAITPANAAEAKKLASEIAGTERQLKRASVAVDEKQRKLTGLRERLRTVGVKNLAQDEATLAGRMAQANRQIAEQQSRLAKLSKVREQHGRQMMHVGMAAGAGMAMQAVGRRGMDASLVPVRSFMEHEDAMLGIARQVPGARNEMGQLTAVYSKAQEEVRSLSGEIPLATTAIADMMTAAARMEVPTEHLKDQVKLAAEMAIAFDAVPDEIAESMGKVAKNYKMPVTAIRGLADSINYLDDNAISKGADIIDFLNRTSGVVSTVAMSAAQAAALGSTLLTLGERTETASTAANAIVQKFAAATKGTKKFQSAMRELGLRSEDVQKGMSSDAVGTLFKVVEAIQKLPQNQRVGVMVELVGMEHSDTLAKLVDKPEELKRQLQLSQGTEASGSMTREAAARYATLSAQWQIAKNHAFNLSSTIGGALAPALIDAMKWAGNIVERMRVWAQENPAMAAGLMKAALAVSALTLGAGMLLAPLALIAGKLLLMRFAWSTMMTAGTGLARLMPIVRLLGSGIMWLGRIALAALATPLGAALALLAGAAYMVWRNWDGIKGGLSIIWQQITEGLSSVWAKIKEFGSKMWTAGADMMSGLANGILSRITAVRDAISMAAGDAVDWFKQKLSIHSPSRVFMALGQHIPEGAALGIQRGSNLLRGAALAMATVPLTAAAGMGGGPLMAAGAGAGGGASVGGGQYHITINGAGMDAQAIARAVSAELDRRESGKRRAVLSQLADIDG